MAPLKDRDLLDRLLEALKEWNCDGFIQWRPRPAGWLRKSLQRCGQKAIGQAMYEHVVNGGEIDQVKENYEGYRDTHPYHYDFRIRIDARPIYVETVFDETKMGPTITIVNIKDA
ncbi:MAG: hypothetical protein NTW96_26585 [Planctomycetia bacterium]|nr:hypothetical protein [Planctomycetia bacterium]